MYVENDKSTVGTILKIWIFFNFRKMFPMCPRKLFLEYGKKNNSTDFPTKASSFKFQEPPSCHHVYDPHETVNWGASETLMRHQRTVDADVREFNVFQVLRVKIKIRKTHVRWPNHVKIFWTFLMFGFPSHTKYRLKDWRARLVTIVKLSWQLCVFRKIK